ncbi:long-chain fatty acid--CoA ligase [Metabacillus litoralis]|uniref:long-chain-fatty-acid--CoA ligase n=1 Tax=Metabacillus TaxID=2675233 RepID=UPI000EF5E376|nr:long-chain fatty acid--CoA ligase [Metabacillus litoralis]MCM3160212.1 long-chain fatty acid--CoA ligase [Metabacillus litoralis]MCM3408798.1 long-chain fatty acid--CoA ligase [Metabacillus litoralis]UHA59546.1 long-chain fatty acid--CoA ligase [Metabacillus litoralis]
MESNQKWLAKYPNSMSNNVDIPHISLPEMLQNTIKKYGNHEAISFYGKRFTYHEVAKMVFAFTSALQQSGVQKGDRVAIMLPNCPQYVVSYYGALGAGGIVTQLNPMLVERELEYILNDAGAETIVVFDSIYPRVKSIQSKTQLKNIITVSLQPSGKDQEEDDTFESFLAKQNGQVLPVNIEPEHDIAVLQYTGGTTGRSKGAMLTHRNVVANAVQSYEFFKEEIIMGQEKCLTVIPLFHVFGMSSCMNLTILCGNCLIMLPRFDLEEVLQTIKKEQPTVFPGVPTMYVAITNHPKAEEYGIDSIKTCNSGSAPMPVELLNEFERKTGAKILEGYGLSEASPTTHCNPPFAERKAGTVGLGLPNTAYKIVDVATGKQEAPIGELGELIISGPQVMKGYWNMPEETAVTLRDGWLFTGDIARMDEEGYVSIVDRKKDLIIASGYNIYPRDIEEILYEHPSVQEAVVIGIPDEYRGETVKAFIVLKSGKTATEEEMIEYSRKHLATYKVPRFIEFRKELPKTNVGKILRRALREEVLKQ